MIDSEETTQTPRNSTSAPQRTTGIPPVAARLLAFVAILFAGAIGGVIGYKFVELQGGANPPSEVWRATGAIGFAVVAALGVAIVAVLTLRAMNEWTKISDAAAVPPEV